MKQKKNTRAIRLVVAGVLVLMNGMAIADGSSPLSLTISEALTHDSNFARAYEARGDTFSQTDLSLKLDKPYGRQNYSLSGRIGATRFNEYKEFNNENYDVDGGFATEIASNWGFSLDGYGSRNLNSAENNLVGQRFQKNVLTTSGGSTSLRYGVSGRWSLVGSLGTARSSYSLAAQSYQNINQNSSSLNLVYSTSDLLRFGFGVGQARSEYPNQLDGEGEEVRQNSISLSSDWQITGFSTVSAVLNFVKNKYRSDEAANISGVTGRLNWKFTPKGLTTYELSFVRTTDSDNSLTGLRTGNATIGINASDNIGYVPVDTVYNNITTSVSGSAKWAATAKTNVSLSGAWFHYDVQRNQKSNYVVPEGVLGSASSSSDYRQVSLSAAYRYSRALGFGCSIQTYKQTVDLTRLPFDGNSVGCNASFTID